MPTAKKTSSARSLAPPLQPRPALSTLPKLSPDAFRVPGSAFSFALPGCDFIFAALREEGGAELLVALFGRFWYSFDGNLRLGVAVETVKQCRTLRRKTT